ncbi:MAG: restriction endonuclease [Candidatus Hydrogenedentota bacterium]
MARKDRGTKGAQFVRYMGPVLKALHTLGGSATPTEVQQVMIEMLGISEDDQNKVTSNGQSRFKNQVHWARFDLSKAGLIDSSKRGVWSLTESGRQYVDLTNEAALELSKKIRKRPQTENSSTIHPAPTDADESPEIEPHKARLLEIFLSLPSAGFERLCQRLLRESGFQQVNVTGRSGDGGIDGNGVLQINPFVSFQVMFQCKRYKGAVGAPTVRDFRGAMMGRADKGIILTTGTFTADATREAVRDGVPPIELVDGERLVSMFEELELGLKPRRTFDVDESFFTEFGEA